MANRAKVEATEPAPEPRPPAPHFVPPRERFLELRARINQRTTIIFGVLGIMAFFAIWEIGSVFTPESQRRFLPPPEHVFVVLFTLLTEKDFVLDIGKSLYRIYASYLIACVVGIPIGVGLGCFVRLRALIGPTIAGLRYLPAVSLVPLLLIWFGPTDLTKMALLFLGCFWFMIVVVLDITLAVPEEIVESSLTMGARRWRVVFGVILRYSAPSILGAIRSLAAIGWTYLVVAEIIAATDGIGAVMMRAGRFLHVDTIMAGILTIGILGVLTDILFRLLARGMFPYQYRRRG